MSDQVMHTVAGSVADSIADAEVTEPLRIVAEAGETPVTESPRPSRLRNLVRLLRANLPFALVLLVVVAAFVRIVQNHWRQGSTLLGGALLLAALLRALLPEDQTGLIVVRRSRLVDVLSYAALGACMVFISLTIQGGPFDH
jgi:hypothetical protein